jgi:hypothetical protein
MGMQWDSKAVAYFYGATKNAPVQVVAWYKTWVCGRSLAGIAGSNPAEGMGVCLLRVSCVLQVEVSASSRSFFQRRKRKLKITLVTLRSSTVRYCQSIRYTH